MKIKNNSILFLLVILTWVFVVTSEISAEDSQRSLFTVQRMSCGSCIARIDRSLQTLDGYLGILVNLRQGLVVVNHKSSLTPAMIADNISNAGYPTSITNNLDKQTVQSLSPDTPGWRASSGGFKNRIMSFFN